MIERVQQRCRHLLGDIALVPRLLGYGCCVALLLAGDRVDQWPGAALLVWSLTAPLVLARVREALPEWLPPLLEGALVAGLAAGAGLAAVTVAGFVATFMLGYHNLGGWRRGLSALAGSAAGLCLALGFGAEPRLAAAPAEIAVGVALPLTFASLMSELAWRQTHRLREVRGRLAEQAHRHEALATRLTRYVPPVLHRMAFDDDSRPLSRRRWLTVCFADLAGFTAFTDAAESEEVVSMLNDFYREMAQAALEHDGMLDKFIGDAVMVFFGDPDSRGRHADARACVAMARQMRCRFDGLLERWRGAGLVRELDLRIGIHSGWCTVGSFGHDRRLEFTVIGSTVNGASRLEGAAAPGQTLLSRSTWLLLGDAAESCRRIRPVRARGFRAPIEAFELASDAVADPLELGCDGLQLRLEPSCLDAAGARRVLSRVAGWLDAGGPAPPFG